MLFFLPAKTELLAAPAPRAAIRGSLGYPPGFEAALEVPHFADSGLMLSGSLLQTLRAPIRARASRLYGPWKPMLPSSPLGERSGHQSISI